MDQQAAATLSIDIEHENLHLLETIPIPGNPSFGTRYRWTLKGLRGGKKLESVLIGNRRYTSTEAVARFITALNAPKQPAPEFTACQRERQNQAARKKLEASGVRSAQDGPPKKSNQAARKTLDASSDEPREKSNRSDRKKLEASGV